MAKNKEFEVTVEKMQYRLGVIKVSAQNPKAAIKKIQDKIDSGKLQTTAVTWWDDPEYVDNSFKTTGNAI